jgi:adenylosuccinate synthase
VLLRYALESAGQLSGLLISHLDVFQRGVSLKWCDGYSISPSLPPWPRSVKRLPLAASVDLDHQRALTHLLKHAQPQYSAAPIGCAPDFLERITAATSLPVVGYSYGPASADVQMK